ncbi:hypothetical protein CLCR_09362 [Cladophialophora carrionii]|uniref:Uncharacterized protein n=1 Tax=Cladophialophora carrionii TaxID=86049 RepID=A0A1C1CTR0_9EURO|nr:hypothetical protein CLCR_09362 [Cladophialophora carrionii]
MTPIVSTLPTRPINTLFSSSFIVFSTSNPHESKSVSANGQTLISEAHQHAIEMRNRQSQGGSGGHVNGIEISDMDKRGA